MECAAQEFEISGLDVRQSSNEKSFHYEIFFFLVFMF